MESLSTGRVADTLKRLFAQAEQADRPRTKLVDVGGDPVSEGRGNEFTVSTR